MDPCRCWIEHFMNLGLEKYKIVLTNGKIIQGPEVADHAIALYWQLPEIYLFMLKI